MTKPVHKFAVLLWVVSVLFLAGDTGLALYIKQFSADVAHGYGRAMVDELTLLNFWNAFRGAILGAGELAALGVIIELVDQVRWNAIPPESRVRTRKSGLFSFLRNWPHSTNN